MKPDRFLLSILIAVGVLVIVSLALFFIRKNAQAYGLEDTPQGIVRNYLLAVEAGDYEKAYGYMQDAPGKPALEQFRQTFVTGAADITEIAVQVGAAEETEGEAAVDLVLMYRNNGPLGDIFREATHALLVREGAGSWKIASLPYPYWGYDWYVRQPETP